MILRSAAALLLLALGCAHRAAAPGATVQAEGDSSGAREPQRYISARAYHHYLDALLAKNADDLVTAAEELREALLYDPESAYLHAVLADVLIKQARIADADAELASALSLDPRHGPAHLLSGRIAVSRNQPMQARDHFQAAIEAQPDDPDAYRELVRLLLSTGDVAAAQAVAERLGERVQPAQGAADEDDDALVAADRLREQAAAVFVEMGRWWAQHGDERAAERAFAQARSASPADPEALIAEATFLEARRKYADARERYLRLLAQRPESPEVIAALARGALAEGDVEAVAAHARKLLALAANLEPSDGASGDREDERRDVSVALLRVAVPLLGAHRSADAQLALEGALRLYPDHPELSFYRALALVQRGRPHEGALAFEAVERSLRARGEDPPSPAFLGIEPDALLLDAQVQSALARGRAGEAPESTRRLRALFAEHPAGEGGAPALLEAFDRAGKAAEAEQVLAASVRAHPEAGRAADSYGFCLLKLGRASEALAELRRADRLTPRDPVILSHLGDALLAAGKKEEALSAFRRALALLLPGSKRRPLAAEAQAMIDPPDRADRDGPRVRAEIEKKLKALAP